MRVSVYKATNRINGKIYIGRTIYSLGKLKKILRKDARKNIENGIFNRELIGNGILFFHWEILASCNTQRKAQIIKGIYIEKYNSIDPTLGYNSLSRGLRPVVAKRSIDKMVHTRDINDIGRGVNNHMYGKFDKDNPNYGSKRSVSTRAKMSVIQRKKRHSEKTIKKMKADAKKRKRGDNGQWIANKI